MVMYPVQWIDAPIPEVFINPLANQNTGNKVGRAISEESLRGRIDTPETAI